MLDKKEEFDLKKTISAVNDYFKSEKFAKEYYGQAETKHDKDFFDWITGKVHCGKCGKIMSPFRALFHFIHF
jgi:hypothetical protein